MLITSTSIDHLQNHFLPGSIGLTHQMHYYVSPSSTQSSHTTVTQVACVDYRLVSSFVLRSDRLSSFLVVDLLNGTSMFSARCSLTISDVYAIHSLIRRSFEFRRMEKIGFAHFVKHSDRRPEEERDFFFQIQRLNSSYRSARPRSELGHWNCSSFLRVVFLSREPIRLASRHFSFVCSYFFFPNRFGM